MWLFPEIKQTLHKVLSGLVLDLQKKNSIIMKNWTWFYTFFYVSQCIILCRPSSLKPPLQWTLYGSVFLLNIITCKGLSKWIHATAFYLYLFIFFFSFICSACSYSSICPRQVDLESGISHGLWYSNLLEFRTLGENLLQPLLAGDLLSCSFLKDFAKTCKVKHCLSQTVMHNSRGWPSCNYVTKKSCKFIRPLVRGHICLLCVFICHWSHIYRIAF